MFTVTKRIEISAAHKLNLFYDSPCSKLHGHNWIITVEVSSDVLNEDGMVLDFTHISKEVKKLDHQNLNEILEDSNPTAENIAMFLYNKLENVVIKKMIVAGNVHLSIEVTKITVQENEGNTACYIP